MATDIKTSKMLNESKSGNFVFEPVNNICTVQILDTIKMESCDEMVGRLAQIINQLPKLDPIETVTTKITNPYDIAPSVFVFDVTIDSPGGDVIVYNAISSMFALAKSRGAIVRTINVGRAASAASLLAVQGTPGYRIMSESAYNLVHYGKNTLSTNRENELKIATNNATKHDAQIFSIYEKCTKLKPEELTKFRTTEGSGMLFAKQCLSKHLCDWILTYDGQLIGRSR